MKLISSKLEKLAHPREIDLRKMRGRATHFLGCMRGCEERNVLYEVSSEASMSDPNEAQSPPRGGSPPIQGSPGAESPPRGGSPPLQSPPAGGENESPPAAPSPPPNTKSPPQQESPNANFSPARTQEQDATPQNVDDRADEAVDRMPVEPDRQPPREEKQRGGVSPPGTAVSPQGTALGSPGESSGSDANVERKEAGSANGSARPTIAVHEPQEEGRVQTVQRVDDVDETPGQEERAYFSGKTFTVNNSSMGALQVRQLLTPGAGQPRPTWKKINRARAFIVYGPPDPEFMVVTRR